jgi:hypothetical protein
MNSIQKEKLPIEIHFPLNDLDIMKILKGVEYTQKVYLNHKQMVHIKVFSSDRVKPISWENWRRLFAVCDSHPELQKVLRFIEAENEHGINPL